MTNPERDPGNEDVLRLEIRSMVRNARQRLGLTQAELGKRVNASRFSINRVEAGVTDLTPPLAEQLEQVLGLTDLRTLVAKRDRLVMPVSTGRDAVVARMLDRPQPRRFRIVLLDNLDLYPMLMTWGDNDTVLRADDIEIVVPSLQRERVLFGEDSDLRRRINDQVKRILDLRRSENYAADSLRLYESDHVTSAVAVALRGDRDEGVIWPPVAVSGSWSAAQAATLPVGTTTDQATVALLNAHIDALIAGLEPLRSNEALCRVGDADEGAREPRFTRYFTVGEDQQEEIDDSEGTAVAMILLLALCPRKRHGVGRRVITSMRASSRLDHVLKHSLFSNTVEHIDIRRSRAEEAGQPVDEHFSTQGAVAAALEIDDYLESKGKIIPDLAFQIAAARRLTTFGLDVDPARLEPVPLPPELRLIEKTDTGGRDRAAIAPRLYVLELNTQPEPELVTLQANAHVEELGLSDIMEETNLNDFLRAARDHGFLVDLLKRKRIVDR
jgi:DNA-binding XRE family transcriptional regulator